MKKYLIHSIIQIKKFDKITFNIDKPLVICDIDNTLLTSKKVEFNCFHKIISNCFFLDNRIIKDTDIKGFKNLEKKVMDLNGKIIFLTSRNTTSDDNIINKDFKKIGLDSTKYEIHYTANKISKGKYVNNYINTKLFNQIIFIDDLYNNHLSMFSYFPNGKYYLFCYDNFI